MTNPASGWWFASLFVAVATWALAPLLLSVVLIHQLGSSYRSPWSFALIIAVVAAVLLTWSWRQIWSSLARLDRSFAWRFHWAWALVGLALALRFVLLEYLPPAHPVLEEIQTGGTAARSLEYGELTLDFRFTNWMAAIGFQIGGYSLEAMRSLFSIAGALSILFMALTLRRLRVGWPATLMAVFTMASLRIFVLGGNTAEEVFGGMIFQSILLYCAVCSLTSKDHGLVWAGFAGIMAGALMYEYTPYRWMIAVPLAAWLWRALTDAEPTERREALWAGTCYVLCLTVVGAVVIADFVKDPRHSYLLEIYFRHSGERPFPLASLTEVKRSAVQMWDYVQVLIGQSDTPASLIYRQPHGSVVPGSVGLVFAAGFLYALWRPRLPLLWIAAMLALLTVIAFGLVASNFNTGILVSIVVLLVLLPALAVDALANRLRESDRLRPLAYYVPVMTAIIVLVNVVSVVRTASDTAALEVFGNNQYSVCRAIREEPSPYQSVHLTTYGGHCTYNDDKWMYPHSDAPIHILDELPRPEEIQPGSLVVSGHAHGLTDDQTTDLILLAVDMESVHTLRRVENLLGKTSAVSFCYRCDAEP